MHQEPYEDRCWEWRGPTMSGYGYLTQDGETVLAHRALYRMAYGPIPDDLLVRHKCDNRLCVNPRHLLLGSTIDNVRDMDARGRRAIGGRHGCAKLTEDAVREIRQCHGNGESAMSLGRRYGVSNSTIGLIVHRRLWKHVA